MDRRTFLTATAIVPFASSALASEPASALDQIKYHVAEIDRILSESRPEGTVLSASFFVVGGKLIGHAFPPEWKNGEKYATFESHLGGWGLKE